MNLLKLKPAYLLLFLILILPGCKSLFEAVEDVKAREALQALAQVQEDYHKKNSSFARNLVQIQEAGMKIEYHTGLVYMEIEDSTENSWRAVALPAESTTARVFAYDTNKGGLYEMDDEEVSSYVLGALNHIREEQNKAFIREGIGVFLMSVMAWFGFMTLRKNRIPGAGKVFLFYLVSMFPLWIAVTTLNHMAPEIVLTPTIKTLLGVSVLLALALSGLSLKSLSKIPKGAEKHSVSMLTYCTILIALFTMTITGHTLKTFSDDPDPFAKYRVAPGSR